MAAVTSCENTLFSNYSSSPNGLLFQRARGIIFLVKSNSLVKTIENKRILASLS